MMHDYDTMAEEKKQGVFYDVKSGCWEYYGESPIIRNKKEQPEFVSEDYEQCLTYKMIMEESKNEN